jgi:hypothetical protein
MQSSRFERVHAVASLQEFFRSSVAESMERQNVVADEHTTYYVVNLLTLFSRSEALFDETNQGLELRPVASVLADAIETDRPDVRNHALQRVGDVSLFIAGFLGDGLARKPVDIDYYIVMGGTAYGTLSRSVRASRRGQVFGPVFSELAEKFHEFVDVLADIREEASNDLDVLRVYETWRRTRSRRAARILRGLGIDPNATEDDDTRH